MEWLKKNWFLIVATASFIVALTTTDVQVQQNKEDIKALENRQSNTEVLLNDIRVELSAINTKLGLLLEGKVIVQGKENGN